MRSSEEALKQTIEEKSKQGTLWDVLVLLEVMTTNERQVILPNYQIIGGTEGTKQADAGRYAGGVTIYGKKRSKIPIQIIDTPKAPKDTMAIATGDNRGGRPLALLVSHRAPTQNHDADKKAIDRYFSKLRDTAEDLRNWGYTVIAAGDYNGHTGDP